VTTPPNDDPGLRRMMHDAVSDVHPDGGTHQIRSRAHAKRPSAARWVPLTLAAAVATVLVIGGAAWLGRLNDDVPAAVPGSPADPTAQGSAGSGRTVEVPVYYVGQTADGPRLFREDHRVPHAVGTDLQVAVQEALSAPPLDPDYESWPTSGLSVTTDSTNELIRIDLTGFKGATVGMNEADARMALQALVWTADAATSSALPVVFQVNGNPAGNVLATDTSLPVQRAGADSVLAPVSISDPMEGATVPTRFEVKGMAATFEANVVWELKQGDRVVRHGFTTATECCTLSPYTFTVNAPPGDYTLVAHDTDPSNGEGVGLSQDTKSITVE
jgi:hypothetical protein